MRFWVNLLLVLFVNLVTPYLHAEEPAPPEEGMALGAKKFPDPDAPPGMKALSTGRYITSGVVGTTVGFGIGHIVQGTWRQMGWVFTLGESVGLLGFFIAIIGDSSAEPSYYDEQAGRDTRDNSSDNLAYAALALYGFKIWEIVDIWTRPTAINGKRYVDNGLKFEIAPQRGMKSELAWGLQLSTNF